MSTLLEQAIVDAKSLKEAALKNAEHALLEKYSEEMKSAVETLLEAEGDEDPLADMGGMGEEEEVEDTLPDVPAAVTDGEDLCPCPDTDEEINIDFDQLKAAVDAEEASLEDDGGALGDDLMGGLPDDADEPALELQEVFMLEEEEVEADADVEVEDDKEELDEGSCGDYKRDPELEEEIELEEADEEGEDDMLDEAALRDMIQEILHVDHAPQPSGTIGGYGYTNDAEIEAETGWNLARMNSDTLAKEEVKEYQKTTKDLKESVRKQKAKTKRYAEAVNTLKEKLDQMTLSNAKLLYMNKVLNSGSLNERQSKKIVEAISKAKSVNEAKVIYETLQSTVGSVERKTTAPKSLSEAVAKKPAFLPRREPKPAPSGELTRWHVLAGLGDKK
jgi:hypothetical protein